MFYTVHHLTKFHYSALIQENVMEVRMQPRTDGGQQCLTFNLRVRPTARVFEFHDHLDNVVHHFNIPGPHTDLSIRGEAVVSVLPPPELPPALRADDWQRIDEMPLTQEMWEMRMPSRFTQPTLALDYLARELGVERRADPLTVLRELNEGLHHSFAYAPQTTRVDSPIDEAIHQRRGVCQDFSHIMLALIRTYMRIPCRYVSGYLYHATDDRSEEAATHAWVEVLLPELGWVGFDPTNNLMVGERHIRAAIGRDYSDVPPTRGVFRGKATSELSVSVRVAKTDRAELPDEVAEELTEFMIPTIDYEHGAAVELASIAAQQQQQ